MIQWIDDFQFFGKDEDELFHNIEYFLLRCQEIGLKDYAEK